MLKRVASISLVLLLGAILSIAIAWACAVWSDRHTAVENGTSGWEPDVVSSSDEGWLRAHSHVRFTWFTEGAYRRSFGLERRAFQDTRAALQDWSTFTPAGMPWPPPPDAVITEAGWPMSCVRAEQLIERDNAAAGYTFSHALVVSRLDPAGRTVQRPLPLRPLWIGFVCNTVTIAALIVAVWLGPRGVRRVLCIIRIERGLCGSCAYPAGQSGVCTECGEQIEQPRGYPAISVRWCLRTVLSSTLIGAVTSIVVAWSCSLWSPIVNGSGHPHRILGPNWWTRIPNAVPTAREAGPGFEINVFESGYWQCHLMRAGWPAYSFEYAIESWSGTAQTDLIHHGIAAPQLLAPDDRRRRHIPLRPMWSGICIDVAAWSTATILIIATVAWRRGRTRRSSGSASPEKRLPAS